MSADHSREVEVLSLSVRLGRLYVDSPQNANFVEWIKERGISLHRCHTPGHASVAELQRLWDAFASAVAVPVHLTDRERFSTLFSNVQLRGDGEWWEL